jgi:hypothetical protein
MANPTSNYGFVMPQNTDLVKDLPADFDIFGQAVDDRIKALNPETTAGDISYRGGTANAKTRLGIGTAGQVLTVNSGATAPEWKDAAGGANFTLLNAGGTTLSGSSTVTVSGISGKDKILVLVDGATCATANQYFNLRLNTDSGNNYNQFGSTGYAGGSYSAGDVIREISDLSTAQIRLAATSNNANSTVGAYVYLTGCNSAGVKAFQMAGAGNPSGGSAQERFSTGGFYSGSSTISSISIVGTNNFNGGIVYVYTSA